MCGDGVLYFYFAMLDSNATGEEEDYLESAEEEEEQYQISKRTSLGT
jgi:hypothetical protein